MSSLDDILLDDILLDDILFDGIIPDSVNYITHFAQGGSFLSISMPKPNEALKEFFADNTIFAAVFNDVLFSGEPFIRPAELLSDDTAYAVTLDVKGKKEKINRYRDIVRRTSQGNFVILGIEDQNKIHYSMPVRKLLYDALGYSSELISLGEVDKSSSWTVDERLSNARKGTKITPIVTVVFYTGETPWDGPRSLWDMMDVEDPLKSFVPNYPLYVIDMGHDMDLHFSNRYLAELHELLSAIYANTAEENQTIINNSIISLAGILANDSNLYQSANQSTEEELKMCEALEKRDAIKFADLNAKCEALEKRDAIKFAELNAKCEALEKRDAIKFAELNAKCEALEKRDAIKLAELNAKCEALEKRDAIKFAELNAKYEATIAEKDAALAEKDAALAEIARLKELLAAANQ